MYCVPGMRGTGADKLLNTHICCHVLLLAEQYFTGCQSKAAQSAFRQHESGLKFGKVLNQGWESFI